MWAKVFKWRVLWAAIIYITVATVMSIVIPQQPFVQFLNICTVSVATAIVVAYIPVWWHSLLEPTLDGPQALSLGIGCTWFAEIGQRMWSVVWRGLDQPGWMTTSSIIPLLLAINLIGGVQHMTVPGAVKGNVPKQAWLWWGVFAGGLTLVLLMAIWFRLFDLPFIAESLGRHT